MSFLSEKSGLKTDYLPSSTSELNVPRLRSFPRRLHKFLTPIPLHPNYRVGFWGQDGKDDYWITQLPIIRLFHSGLVCVHLFFVLSGFSITLKPLKLARRGQYDQLFDSLVSATFRRAARLYLPCLALLLIILGMVCVGFFDYAHKLAQKENWPFAGIALQPPPVLDTYGAQFKNFWQCFWQWSDPLNPYSRITDMPYSGQLWTIPVELKCSLITWIALLGLAKARPYIRITVMTSLAIWSYARTHTDPTLFITGCVLAELYLDRAENAAKVSADDETQGKKAKDWVLFLLSLFLGSYPRKGDDKALGFSLLHKLGAVIVGEKGRFLLEFYTCLGSILCVYSVSQSLTLQRMFSTPLAKYLGKISFALYCVHQPLINWFGYRNILFWWSVTGNESTFTFELGFLIAFTIQLVVTVWVADVFCRAVDEPSVRLARWLEQKFGA